MTKARLVTLQHGDQRATIAPAIGGSLATYDVLIDGRRIDLVRPCIAPDEKQSVLDLACFPLVPYSSRIRHGRFRFAGREVRLPLNFGDHPHSIHGHGWQRAWTVVESDSAAMTLDLRHAADSWPWAYHARQRFVLDEDGLLLTLTVTSEAAEPMPVGLGLHPYFPRAREAWLKANVSAVWQMDQEVMPLRRAALPANLALPDGVALKDVVLDNGFEGWDGKAEIAWPPLGLGLDLAASPALSRLVVYAPAGEDFFCVEPVSHMTDAFNRAADGDGDTGMHVLAPGETFAAWMRLSPRRL